MPPAPFSQMKHRLHQYDSPDSVLELLESVWLLLLIPQSLDLFKALDARTSRVSVLSYELKQRHCLSGQTGKYNIDESKRLKIERIRRVQDT